MTITVAHASSCIEGVSATSATSSATFTSTSGNLLIAGATCAAVATEATPPFADGGTNTWTHQLSTVYTSPNQFADIGYVANCTGKAGEAVTFTAGGSGFPDVTLLEVSGCATTSPCDIALQSSKATGTSVNTPLITPAAGDHIIVVVGCNDSGGVQSVANLGTGAATWTLIKNDSATGEPGFLAYTIVTANGTSTYGLTYSNTVSGPMISAISAFKAASGGDTTPPTFASAAVASNGQSIAVTLTETGSPPVLPASGVTGFSVTSKSRTIGISSATASGTTVTLNLYTTIATGWATTVSYTPGNVTDSSSNAMLAFGAQSATNSSTVPAIPYVASSSVTNITWDAAGTVASYASGSDCWPITWADDNCLYTPWGDGGGFGGSDSNGRVSAGIGKLTASAAPGSLVEGVGGNMLNVDGDTTAGHPWTAPFSGWATGKVITVVSVGTNLYAITTSAVSANGLMRSTNKGATWTDIGATWPWPSVTAKPVYFLQAGQANAAAPGSYVYIYCVDTNGTGDTYLVRCTDPMSYATWEWYTGTPPAQSWSSSPTSRTSVFKDSLDPGIWDPGPVVTFKGIGQVIYVSAIGRYLAMTPHGGTGQVGMYDSTNPWGPWTTVYYSDAWLGAGSDSEGLYYSVVDKWTTSSRLQLVFSGFSTDAFKDKFSVVGASFTSVVPTVISPLIAPQLVVEVSFTTIPSATPVWVDVSHWVQGQMQIRRGRQRELDVIQAGELSCTLDNRDRRFDPTYTASPYYPNVLPMRRIRAHMIYNGTDYPLFSGYIESWGQEWSGWQDATVPITASDAFKPINLAQLNTLFPSQTSDQRVNAVLSAIGWTIGGAAWTVGTSALGTTTVVGPTGDRVVSAGSSTLQTSTLANVSALQHLQDVTATEMGFLFADRGGALTFYGRNRVINTAPLGTFGEGAGELPYVNIELTYDDTRIWNDIQITRVGGLQRSAADTTSQAQYYTRTLSNTSTLQNTDTEAQSLASALVSKYAQPTLQVTAMTLDGWANPGALFPQMLSREIGDTITVNRRPPGGGQPISQLSTIQGIGMTYAVTGGALSVTWRLSAADILQYWTLNNSTLSVLGSTTRVFF